MQTVRWIGVAVLVALLAAFPAVPPRAWAAPITVTIVGSSSAISTLRGYLSAAIRSLQWAMSPSGVAVAAPVRPSPVQRLVG